MAQIVVRGESVYKCDVCNRKTRVPTNREGLDVIQRCIITEHCKGVLRKVTLLKDINDTPAIPLEVTGLTDWTQRRVLYTHTQTVQSIQWNIKHNLENKPIVDVFQSFTDTEGNITYTPVAPDEYTVNVTDLNNLVVTFKKVAIAGVAQCIALSSQNTTNPNSTAPAAASTAAVQITSNTGEFTIATLDNSPTVSISFTYITNSTTADVIINYTNVDNAPSLNSPWVGNTKVFINGKTYTVRSFNLVDNPPAPPIFATGQIPNGTAFFITSINGVPVKLGDGLILLGNAPYAAVDKINNKYIDVAAVSTTDPQTYYQTGLAFAEPAIIKTTYPPIVTL